LPIKIRCLSMGYKRGLVLATNIVVMELRRPWKILLEGNLTLS